MGASLPRPRALGPSAAALLGLLALTLIVLPRGGGLPAPALSPEPGAAEPRAAAAYGELPLAFEPNAGRYGDDVSYVASSRGGALAVGTDGIRLTRAGAAAITMAPLGATLETPLPIERLPGVVNDLRGDDPGGWQTEIPTYSRLRYASVYPGIDLELYGSQRKGGTLEYDFRIAAGADPERIAVGFGPAATRIAGDGALVVGHGAGALRQAPPIAFQPSVAGRDPVPVRFARKAGGIGFDLGDYDRSRPLVIDPLLIDYSTYLGGDSAEDVTDLVVDDAGFAYMAGSTVSTDFNRVGGLQSNQPDQDGYIAKLNPAGTALAYSTYIGGNGSEAMGGLAVDGSGSAYLVGETTATDYPTAGTLLATKPGGQDGFVSKLNPAGNGLVYSGYLGGTGGDTSGTVAIDATGAAYIGGSTTSTDFPTVNQIEGDDVGSDATVTKINPAGTALVYSTYLGGGGSTEFLTSIAVDGTGAAYVVGTTSSTDFNLVNPIQTNQPALDAFLSKLTPAGSGLAYSTYIGGPGSDQGGDVAIDGGGAAYVAASTDTTGYPTTVGAFDTTLADDDGAVTKVNPGGTAFVYSTLLGGSGEDSAGKIALDAAGNAYVSGSTRSSDFPEVGAVTSNPSGPLRDTFLARLNPGGSALTFSNVFGGDGDDQGTAVDVDSSGSIYTAGQSGSTNLPLVHQIEGDSAGEDTFIAKFDEPAETSISSGPAQGSTIADATPSFTYASSEPDSSFQCKLDGAASFSACPASHTLPALANGFHTLRVRTVDDGSNPDPTPVERSFAVNAPDPDPDPAPDTIAPDTLISSKPKPKIKLRRGKKSVTVSFEFIATEPGSSLQCSLDGDAFAACTSPRSLKLRKGAHTFSVRATDAAGNTDATPASAKVTVKKAKKKR